MNYVIAFAGKAHSGKSTSKQALIDLVKAKYPQFQVVPISFAAKLKDVAKDLFGWDGDKEVYFNLDKDNTPVKDRGRNLLINIGQHMRDIRPTVWADYAAQEIDDWIKNSGGRLDYIFVIDDLRFKNEMAVLEKYNLIKVKLERPQSLSIDDISEKDLDDYNEWDAIINNAGEVSELTDLLDVLIKELILSNESSLSGTR